MVSLLPQANRIAGRESAPGGGPAARAARTQRAGDGDDDAGLLSLAVPADHASVPGLAGIEDQSRRDREADQANRQMSGETISPVEVGDSRRGRGACR